MKLTKADIAKLAAIAGALENLKTDLEAMAEPRRAAYDDMSEAAQEGERGQALDHLATALEEAIEHIEAAGEMLVQGIE